ncbi:MAG: hypothetical protein AAFY59_17715 [Pseudomonadota bacterium]
MTRALLLLGFLATASIGLTYFLGAEILAALGMILAQLKIVLAKAASLSSGVVLNWLKAQGINFARVEIAKRWFLKSLLPLILGAALQRQIASAFGRGKEIVARRQAALMGWYRELPKPARWAVLALGIVAMLGLTMSSLGLWVLVFTVQVPIWLVAAGSAGLQVLWRTLQKMVFRTLAFMKIMTAWGFLRRRMPAGARRRLRRMEFRIARTVVRQRKLTLRQVRNQKDGLAMRWALLKAWWSRKGEDAPRQ